MAKPACFECLGHFSLSGAKDRLLESQTLFAVAFLILAKRAAVRAKASGCVPPSSAPAPVIPKTLLRVPTIRESPWPANSIAGAFLDWCWISTIFAAWVEVGVFKNSFKNIILQTCHFRPKLVDPDATLYRKNATRPSELSSSWSKNL